MAFTQKDIEKRRKELQQSGKNTFSYQKPDYDLPVRRSGGSTPAQDAAAMLRNQATVTEDLIPKRRQAAAAPAVQMPAANALDMRPSYMRGQQANNVAAGSMEALYKNDFKPNTERTAAQTFRDYTGAINKGRADSQGFREAVAKGRQATHNVLDADLTKRDKRVTALGALTGRTPQNETLTNSMLTNLEKQNYYYIAATQGRQEAENYRQYLLEQNEINKKLGQERYERVKDAGAPAQLATSFAAGMSEAIDSAGTAGDAVLGRASIRAASPSAHLAQELTEGVDTSNTAGRVYQKALKLANNVGSNVPSMVTGALFTPAAGSAMFATQAAGSAYQEVINNGGTIQQAQEYAALQAIDEEITNAFLGGITARGGGLLKKALGNTAVARWMSSALRGMFTNNPLGLHVAEGVIDALADGGSEAAQEYLQYFTERFEKYLATGETPTFNIGGKEKTFDQLVAENGYQGALSLVLTNPDALESAMFGFLNAELMNNVGNTGNALNTLGAGRLMNQNAYQDVLGSVNTNADQYRDANTYDAGQRLMDLAMDQQRMVDAGKGNTLAAQYERGLMARQNAEYQERVADTEMDDVSEDRQDYLNRAARSLARQAYGPENAIDRTNRIRETLRGDNVQAAQQAQDTGVRDVVIPADMHDQMAQDILEGRSADRVSWDTDAGSVTLDRESDGSYTFTNERGEAVTLDSEQAADLIPVDQTVTVYDNAEMARNTEAASSTAEQVPSTEATIPSTEAATGGERLAQLATETVQTQEATKQAQTRAIYEARKNNSPGLQTLVNNATMLSDGEVNMALTNGARDAVSAVTTTEVSNGTGQERTSIPGRRSDGTVSQRTGEQTGRVSAETEAVRRIWRAGKAPADTGSETLRITRRARSEEVIPGAKKGTSVFIPANQTASMKNGEAEAKSFGLNVVSWAGGEAVSDKGTRFRGMTIPGTDTLYAQADNRDFSQDKIIRHEIAENKLTQDDFMSIFEEARKNNPVVDEAVLIYQAFADDESDEYHAAKELICDSNGMMNQFERLAKANPNNERLQLYKDILDSAINAIHPVVSSRLDGKKVRPSETVTKANAADVNNSTEYSVELPYRFGSEAAKAWVDTLEPEARKTADMFSELHDIGLHNKAAVMVGVGEGRHRKVIDVTTRNMLASEWNNYVDESETFASTARKLAEALPDNVRKEANITKEGRIIATPFEKSFKMMRSFMQRIVDALPGSTMGNKTMVNGKEVTISKEKTIPSIGGEAYRKALLEERRRQYRKGILAKKSIGGLSKDTWGTMGFLATNTKTTASGDFTTFCPQMMYGKGGCWYCYRLAALVSGVNNKLVGENVWYTGEILRLKPDDIKALNKNGGLRIQSFGDWQEQYTPQLLDMLVDAETVGLQIKIITKEPSMVDAVALLKEQGYGKNLYFNLSADYTIEEAVGHINPARPFMEKDGKTYWKRAFTVEEANEYRKEYPWVNTRIVATTMDEFIRGLESPYVDVVTGYHGKIRSQERISSENGEMLTSVEPLGDAGMPRFRFDVSQRRWVREFEGKTKLQKRLADAIEERGLQYAYYVKTCCQTGRCATCEGKCGALARDFNVKNATNRDEESVKYWQKMMKANTGGTFGDRYTYQFPHLLKSSDYSRLQKEQKQRQAIYQAGLDMDEDYEDVIAAATLIPMEERYKIFQDGMKAGQQKTQDSSELTIALKPDIEEAANSKDYPKVIRQGSKEDLEFSTALTDKNLNPKLRVNMATFFSGTGTVDFALRNIVRHEFAVEYDAKIAAVYRANNGDNIYVDDVRNVNIDKHKGKVEYFHASPVCKSYSNANNDMGEKELDIETAEATAEAINTLQPKVVTVENVARYKNSRAMQIIEEALKKNGYAYDKGVYRASDFGGATIRERMFLRAVKDGALPKIDTSEYTPMSWYDAVEDLVPDLPEASLPNYMQERLEVSGIDPDNLEQPVFVLGGEKSGKLTYATADKPAPTILAKSTEAKILMPDGRVLRATPRVMARIQGLPDGFNLMDGKGGMTNAYKIVGNGVPVQLTQGIVGPLLEENLIKQKSEDTGIEYSRSLTGGMSTAEIDRRLNDLVKKYGALPKGENAKAVVNLPAQTSDNKNTRRYVRTVLESGLMSEQMSDAIKSKVLNEALSYEPMSDKASAEYAASVLRIGGVERMQREWDKARRSDTFTKDDMAVGQFLLKEYAKAGDIDGVLNMVTELAAEGTRMGQNIQAMRMLKKYAQQVPAIGLGYIQRTVDQMNRDAKKKMGKKYKEMKIDPKLAAEYMNAQTRDEIDASLAKIYKNLGAQVQKTVPEEIIDRLRTWRYMSMLGNPRTHVRNMVGNAIFVPAVQMKDVIGAGLEKAAGADRTKSVYTTAAARAFAKQDALLMRDVLQGNAEKSIRDLILEQRKVFTNPALNYLSKANGEALETEDWWFLRAHYQNALAQYITANGLNTQNMDGTMLARARKYAVKEAQKATYRDANKVSTWLNQSKGAGAVVKYMMEGMLPFKKTPTNILRRGIEYSPAMVVERMTKGIYDLNTNKITLNEYIDGLASGLTGTAIFGLGMFLASTGAIIGGYADDEDKEKRKLRGLQEYSVKIGDHTYTVDWAAPGSLPLFVGVETMYALMKEKGMTMSDMTAAIGRLVDPMINMSMLSGLNDTLDAISYAEGDKLSALTAETFYSLLGQYVPTIFGQVARTVDTTQRINYQDKNKGMSKNMLYFLEKMQNKIPYMTFSNDPYLNEFGQENVTESRFVAALQNFISPGYISQIKDDKVLDEIERLQDAQEENVLPKKMPKYLGTKEDRVDLTSAQYTTFQRTAGQLAYNILDRMIDDKRYDNLTAEEQAEVIKMAYDYAKAMGRMEIQPEYVQDLKGDAKKIWGAVMNGEQAYDVILSMIASKKIKDSTVGEKNDKGEVISGSKKAEGVDKILALNVSDAEKARMYEREYPSEGLVAWKYAGGSTWDYMMGEKLTREVSKLSDEKKKKAYSYVVSANGYTNQQKVAWFQSEKSRTESKNYIAWKDAKGSDWDYIKSRSDLDKFTGLDTKTKRSKVVSYIKKQTTNDAKRKALWQMAGYDLDSKKNGKTVKNGNYNKYMK